MVKLARNGHPTAIRTIAHRCLYNDVCPVSRKDAHDMLAAHAQTDGESATELGVIYHWGKYGAADDFAAAQWLGHAHALGGDNALLFLKNLDRSALLSAMTWHHMQLGHFRDEPGSSMLNGGAHFYRTYQCADGKFIAVGAIEPQFYAALLTGLELTEDQNLQAQFKRDLWPQNAETLAGVFRTRPRDVWVEVFEDLDACVSPVLTLQEASQHPQNVQRNVFPTVGGTIQPAPAPQLSETPATLHKTRE